MNNENDAINNLFDSKAKVKINNENDAIKNPFDLKTKAKIYNKNYLKKLKLKSRMKMGKN